MADKAVVTGGAGFIGSRLVLRLAQLGWSVKVIDDLSSGYGENLDHMHGDVKLVLGSVTEWTSELDAAVKDASVVFHLAASVGNKRSIDEPMRDSQVNVLGTIAALEAARRHGVANFVYSSSAGIYGQLVQLPIDEHHPIEPDSPYGASKLAGEKMGLSYSRLYDMTVVALRYFNVYGPGQRYDAYGNVVPIWGRKLLRDARLPIFGDGNQTRDFVFVDDVVAANIAAATSNQSGAFNIGSGQATRLSDLAELMGDSSGRHLAVEHLPERPGDVRDSVADISRAREVLGFRPATSLRSGIEQYLAWLAAEDESPRPSGSQR